MWHRNGIESRNLLSLWKEDGVAIPFREFLAMVLQERRNRNGTESRDLLPLWKEDGVAIPFRESMEMALQERWNRNGTESLDLLPLWEDGKVGGKWWREDEDGYAADYRPPAFSSRRSSGWRSEERLSSTDTTIAQTARPMKKYSATTGEEARSMMWPTTIGTVKSPMFCTQ